MWHQISQITSRDGASAEAQIVVPKDSAWFDGHFPGMPLLPGIAQLAMVEAVIAQTWPAQPQVARYSRVRFKLKIAPGAPVTVTVTRQKDKQDQFSFQIATPEGIACVGNAQAPTDEKKTVSQRG